MKNQQGGRLIELRGEVNLSNDKTTLLLLIGILATYPAHPDRIMVNGDSGSIFLEGLIEFSTDEKITAEGNVSWPEPDTFEVHATASN